MSNKDIVELQQVFTTRLESLNHILDIAEKHIDDLDALMQKRIAPDMFPFGTQIAITCNQARGFYQWCTDKPTENAGPQIETMKSARSKISETKAMLAEITANDSILDEVKRVDIGPGTYLELPGRRYIDDYLIPNLYFHITTAYAILRNLDVPIGKASFLTYIVPNEGWLEP
jgi:hypothetical protein